MKITFTLFILHAFTAVAFSQVPENWKGKVMTVKGLISADSMGITLPHEHLLIVHKFNYLDLTNESDAITELGYYANAGGKTLFEASAIGIGRNPEGLKRISTATGVNVVMSAGYYKDLWIPDSIKNKSIGQLTKIIINDIVYGINGIHAGFIKIAMSNPITPFEEKVLIAAARAQKATGAAIDVHFDGNHAPNEDRHHVLDVFENEGVDLTRVCLSHCVPFVDLVDDFITMAQRGCYLAFDMTGLEIRVDFDGELKLAETLNALINAGYLEQILISQDVCFSVCYVKNGGYGYAHILNNIVPQLKTKGITDEHIVTMMVENPKRVFPFKNNIEIDQCVNEIFTAASGIISDNSGESNYNNNLSCYKLIVPSGAVNVALMFNSFATENGYDYVRVYDGGTTSATLLGEFSGTTLPSVVTSTGGSMLIAFRTDFDVVAAGWSATYTGNMPFLSITPESIPVSPASGTSIFRVASNIDWTVSDSSSWLSAIKINDTTLTVSYDENTIVDSRSSEITVNGAGVTSQYITINQGGVDPVLSITPESIPVSPASGTTTFTVASNIDWSVSESSSWLTATKTDDTTLTVIYDENSIVDSRSSEITVSGEGVASQYITINQDGVDPVLSVTPESIPVSPASGTTTFTVASNIDWSVSESSSWLTATKTDDTTLTVIYDENSIVDSRSSEITVSGVGVASQYITINQSGVDPALSVTPESIPVSPASGTTTFTVASNIDWSVSESSSWLTATKTDDTTLTIIYDENSIVDSRSSEITVSGEGVASQYITINQDGVNPALSVTPESILVSPASGTSIFRVASNIDWSVSESSSWLTATKTDDTTLTIIYDENSIVDSRSSEITVSGEGVASQYITINQGGVDPILDVAPVSISISASSGTTTFSVTSNIDWSASDSSSWLTATKADDTTVAVIYDENTSTDFRFTWITVGGAGENSQSVYILQEGAIPSIIKGIAETQQIVVFPNPVSNSTWLSYPKGRAKLIEIYEPSGRLIFKQQVIDLNGKTEIDFSGLNSGLYLYRVFDHEGNIFNGKILKE